MSKRLENAILKLYHAFHNGALNPECCKQCAVGNILDNTDSWKYLSDNHGSTKLNYVGLVNQKLGRKFGGYAPLELLEIERVFLKACGYSLPFRRGLKKSSTDTQDNLFKGLEATVAYLCKLDGNKNIMDCKTVFDYQPTEAYSSI